MQSITMLVNNKTKNQLRLQNIIFLALIISITAALSWLSTRYKFEADWTESGRNTLSDASTSLINKLDGPITVTSYATEDENIRRSVAKIFNRYQRHKNNLILNFINPDLVPDTIRSLGITVNGELIIEYQGRKENLKNITEYGITNTLQRLARDGERWLVFLDGHGERKPHGKANHDYGNWIQQLEAKGLKAQTHTLAQTPRFPDNTKVLVLAGPRVDLLSGEVDLVKQFVSDGGNLLWLAEPGDQHGLNSLANILGVTFESGTIVDPTTQILGLSDPRFAIVANYAAHAITKTVEGLTLYPQAVGIKLTPPVGWTSHNLLITESRSWSESGEVKDSVQFNSDTDIAGPFTIGIALSRKSPTSNPSLIENKSGKDKSGSQRIVIIGDGDFLSNAYLGNGGNLQMGENIINWLAHDDSFIDIPVKVTSDKNLQLSPMVQGIIGIGFLFIIPIIFFGTGFYVWWTRRKR